MLGKSLKGSILLAIWMLMGLVPVVWGGSQVKFTPDFKNWKLYKQYRFPCQNLEAQPEVVRNLAVMLCPLLTKDSEIFVYIRPEVKPLLSKGKQAEYPDGTNFAFVATKVKDVGDIVLFKAHDLGEPIYGVYTVSGKDIEGAVKLLKTGTCVSCHNVYCQPHGVCAVQEWNNIR